MKIAYLGWGSLIWNPGELSMSSEWLSGGPVLQLEFSRISSHSRLTLVIDIDAGVPLETYYATSGSILLPDALENLRMREGRTKREFIGHIDLRTNTYSLEKYPNQVAVHETIASWGYNYGFDAVIWTALPSNFCEREKISYSVESAISYLKNLPEHDKAIAIEYIQNAPQNIQTPFRLRFSELLDSGML